MRAILLTGHVLAMSCLAAAAYAQQSDFELVSTEMLEQPSADDWLSFSRTPDAQRFSPLSEIDRDNVGNLALAWSRGLGRGTLESIPIVHDGVMYMLTPGAIVQAVNATNGDLLWEFQPELENSGSASLFRGKTLAICEDLILISGPESNVMGIDARDGTLRWQTKVGERGHTSGPIIADGKMISGGGCAGNGREHCYIAAHDARTGELLWRFFTTQAPDDRQALIPGAARRLRHASHHPGV